MNTGALNRAIFQYGRPLGRFEYHEDFPVIDLKGRVYAKYFEEINATIVLYAMAPDWKVIDEVDRRSCPMPGLAGNLPICCLKPFQVVIIIA